MSDYEEEDDEYRPSFGGVGGLGFQHASTTKNAANGGGGQEHEDEEEEANERPAFGGMGFRPPAAFTQGAAPDHEDAPPPKKMRFSPFESAGMTSKSSGEGASGMSWTAVGNGGGGSKKATGGGGGGGGSGFAARMMAQMGYKEGEGLGKDGRGRLAPISAQLRPQGAGLGAVREKTQQAKEEEKRAAAFRGETVEEDSEEEERRRKKEARKRRREQGLNGMGVGRKAGQAKTRYRTAAEIEVESEGLRVPNMLKTLIDITGKETTYEAPSGKGSMVAQETEAVKIARRAKRDLEAFAEEWNNAKEHMSYLDMENEQLVTELDKEGTDSAHVQSIVEAVEALQGLSLGADGGGIMGTGADDGQWESLTKKLEKIEVDFQNDLSKFGIHEVAVAAIQPLFKASMADWEPLEQPDYLINYLTRLQHILGADTSRGKIDAVVRRDQEEEEEEGSTLRPSKRSTSYYETLIYTLWLPRVQSAITNNWDVQDPTPLERLLKAWRPLLPEFIITHVVNQLLLPRLLSALSAWKPSRKAKVISPPHHWLFPWLEYLPASQLDPQSHSGLAVELRRKVRSLLSQHDIGSGAPEWLKPLRSPLLPQHVLSKVLTNTLLPRLSAYLSANFTIDPAEQDIEPLEHVLTYQPLFSSAAFAELLVAGFFPKFHAILHAWLAGAQPDYNAIQQWFLWWKDEMIPEALNNQVTVDAQWTAALEMISAALELGDDAGTRLPPVESFMPRRTREEEEEDGDRRRRRSHKDDDRRRRRHHHHRDGRESGRDRHRRHRTRSPKEDRQQQHDVAEEVTYRDLVELFVADHGLLLMPMREAHPTNGAPLLRITANATGKGGVVAYVQGDLLRVRKRLAAEDGTEVTSWPPMGLDDALVRAAGG